MHSRMAQQGYWKHLSGTYPNFSSTPASHQRWIQCNSQGTRRWTASSWSPFGSWNTNMIYKVLIQAPHILSVHVISFAEGSLVLEGLFGSKSGCHVFIIKKNQKTKKREQTWVFDVSCLQLAIRWPLETTDLLEALPTTTGCIFI